MNVSVSVWQIVTHTWLKFCLFWQKITLSSIGDFENKHYLNLSYQMLESWNPNSICKSIEDENFVMWETITWPWRACRKDISLNSVLSFRTRDAVRCNNKKFILRSYIRKHAQTFKNQLLLLRYSTILSYSMMTYFPMKPSIRITRLTLDQKESRYKHNPVKHLRSILRR